MSSIFLKSQSTIVIPSTALSGTAVTTAPVPCGNYRKATLIQRTTAVAGTSPSLAMKLQGSPDGTAWDDVASGGFSAKTTNSGLEKLSGLDISGYTQLRLNYTVTGSAAPTVTAQVDMQLYQV